LLAALVCMGGIAVAQASTVEDWVTGLYANPKAIASLCDEVIPQGWEDALELEYSSISEGYGYIQYQVRGHGLEMTLFFETEGDALDPLIFTSLDMWSPLGPSVLFSFTMYGELLQEKAHFRYSDDDMVWGVDIPPAMRLETLTEFVTLADFCASPAEDLDMDELDDRAGEIESFLQKWRTDFDLQYDGLHDGVLHTCVEANFAIGLYSLHTRGPYDWLSYALTEEQFKTVYDACHALAPHMRPTYIAEYAAELGLAPTHIQQLACYEENDDDSPGDTAYYLRALDYDGFVLTTYAYGWDDGDAMLTQEQYDAFAAAWLPLSQAERLPVMRETYEHLSGK